MRRCLEANWRTGWADVWRFFKGGRVPGHVLCWPVRSATIIRQARDMTKLIIDPSLATLNNFRSGILSFVGLKFWHLRIY